MHLLVLRYIVLVFKCQVTLFYWRSMAISDGWERRGRWSSTLEQLSVDADSLMTIDFCDLLFAMRHTYIPVHIHIHKQNLVPSFGVIINVMYLDCSLGFVWCDGPLRYSCIW